MEKLINLIKEHKKAILIPSISVVFITIIALFAFVCLMHFCNINQNYILTSGVSEITTTSMSINTNEVLVVALENTIEDETDTSNEIKNTTKQEENSNEKKQTNTSSSSPYYIKVNYSANTITIYTKDSNGNYTVPYKAMVCSTGYASPKSGVYKTRRIGTWHTLFGGVYGQYCTQITGHILFHSVPYTSRGNHSSLEYWEYDKLGTTASAGCIRLQTCDALWIYNNCGNGTQVEFYSSSNPGPLGKPSSTFISKEASPYKNWDPTDPNPNNPWKNKENNKTENNSQNQNTTQDNNNQAENTTQNTNNQTTNSSNTTVSKPESNTTNNNINKPNTDNTDNTTNSSNTNTSNSLNTDTSNNTNTSNNSDNNNSAIEENSKNDKNANNTSNQNSASSN